MTQLVHPKMGFHAGVGGNPTGIGEHLSRLDAAGIPFFIKSVDGMTGLFDAQVIMQNSTVPHTAVFRRSVRYQGCADIADPNVPDYNMEPEAAAAAHWAWHKAGLPPELDGSLVWIETVNELAKEVSKADWIGNFLYFSAQLAMADGYKFCGPGYASGTPDIGAWETDGMLRYLELCQDNPNGAGVALHEYSYNVDDIWNQHPNLIGRFEDLFFACDRQSIKRPKVLITEWGWEHENVPSVDRALADIKDVAGLYAVFPEILGAAIWYLGSGYGDIANQVQPLIGPVTDMTIETTFEVDDMPTDIPPANIAHTIHLLPQDITLDELQAVTEFLHPTRSAFTYSADVAHAVDYAGNENSKVIVWDGDRWADDIYAWLHERGATTESRSFSELGAPPPVADFPMTHWPTEYLTVTQIFGNDPDRYGQYGLPGHEGLDLRAYTGTGVYAVADGEVIAVESYTDGHNYGNRIRIKTGKFTHIYAHLQSMLVFVGDIVEAGALIGYADATGNSDGSHLHFTLKSDDAYQDGDDYIGYPYNIVDPTPYFTPFNPTWPEIDPPPPPEYTGPPVGQLVAGVVQPANEWDVPKWDVFGVTGLPALFYTKGDSYNKWNQYKSPLFNMVRNWSGVNDIGGMYPFYNQGARDFECDNELNLTGIDGATAGAALKEFCLAAKAAYPGIRLWFPGMSPQFGGQFAFIDAAKAAGGFDEIYGVCEHVYTGIVDNVTAAAQQMFDEVMLFRSKYAMTRPLVITEYSVNRPASPDYKAAVYRTFIDMLTEIEGIAAAYSFTADWSPDPNQESWYTHGIMNWW